ncbi:MAG TPA: L-aspartate oxidase [Roseiarcus sp.]|nr:L-aspartate oxidase [Roseiarcus sp.]
MSAEILSLRGRVIIVGAGVAGLMTALELAPRPVVVLSKGPLGAEGSTLWAQGGLAAAMGANDGPALHAADTLAAGDGFSDSGVVGRFTCAAPAAIERLARLGVRFDRVRDGGFALGLEAAHSRARIVHAGGDGAGRELMRALAAAARAMPSIEILEGFEARRLFVEDNSIRGLIAAGPSGPALFATNAVVIATGGIGGLFEDSTNPRGSFGQGVALAARAGAALRDMHFVQFHPTALDVALRPAPLVSEAVRGEGATLIDETGERFMAGVRGAELAPRDVVARAIWRRRAAGHRVFLDARAALGAHFATRFPIIAAACREGGVDPAREPIPVRPAQHYHMGGVWVDAEGRSSVTGLWACGEAACTGLHGANRLASNSLSEAAVFGAIVARSIDGAPALSPAPTSRSIAALHGPSKDGRLQPDPAAVRPILSPVAGVMREGEGLRRAVGPLAALARSPGPAADPAAMALVIVIAALRSEYSAGAHCRLDFPNPPAEPRRSRITLAEALAEASAVAPDKFAKRA